MGTHTVVLGESLTNGEHVLRGLNPKLCEDGRPTEGCFILSRNDPPDDGPSFGILKALPGELDAPLGMRQGISPSDLASVLPSRNWGIARINVGEALKDFRDTGILFVQKDAQDWGEYAKSHAMLTGHQHSKQHCKDLMRHLLKISLKAVVKTPSP